MSFFSTQAAARRYAQYRPKVHAIVRDWLGAHAALPVGRALDVACGTGDSTQALLPLATEVVGIDQSSDMLAQAKAKQLDVHCLPYQQASTLGRFHLITTAMAFHWFDRNEAIRAYKNASEPGALWLNYNFAFGGSAHSDEFNRWFSTTYLQTYPSPKRNAVMSSIRDDRQLESVATWEGSLPIRMTQDALVGYLTTQSNIEAAVAKGTSYEDIERTLHRALSAMNIGEAYLYNYQYEIYRNQP